MTATELDFRRLFECSPEVLLVLLPDAPKFTMVAATEARLQATFTTREQSIGRGVFEVFPDNPGDPAADGSSNLRESLQRVIATREPDTMAVQKYDIREADGTFTQKYWSPKNIPILSERGEILYILHRVEDVTDLVRAEEGAAQESERRGRMEREVITRSRELGQANRNLREANSKLSELDAAKTAFFNNISHEFRTPLTLMLGPIEDALADAREPLGPGQRARIRLAHDNSLRLFKLVNALLDFARIEAGRLRARFAPIDLPGFTAELAGMFQSAADRAHVYLVVDCPDASQPAWIDREMWEKIVPNLISNALKFTFDGEIAIRLHEVENAFVLEVADTGVGIPAEEQPRIFDRFHRVAGATGRTNEGTGIGLSLVKELVKMHGGSITVQSALGKGSTFRVEIPKGYAHLPADAVSLTAGDTAVGHEVRAHAVEAAHWDGSMLDERASVLRLDTPQPQAARARVLVVDDNADLREYISALLSPYYDVEIAVDGLAAIAAIEKQQPNVIVSDVMMPRMGGFDMVRQLRANPETASLPVILLSARAGEEAAVDGLGAGADDYLAKPFSGRELLARVRTHVNLARARREWVEQLERANRELDAFSYSVSHDLRAPLRAISGYCQLLVEDCGSELPAPAGEYIGRMNQSVTAMGSLIESLLNLSRISRAEVTRETVDLSRLSAQVITELERAHPNRSVTATIQSDLRALGDSQLLGVVLVNLLSNAWKFTARAAAPMVEVGRQSDGDRAFFVRDNGAGFDMAAAENLFQPFRRLHSAEKFSGTGVGLATVSRAVARHGGRIWAESEVGRGATFYFTIPDTH